MSSCFTAAIAPCRIRGVRKTPKFSGQKLTCPATGLKHKNSYALYQVMFLCSLFQDLIVNDDTYVVVPYSWVIVCQQFSTPTHEKRASWI